MIKEIEIALEPDFINDYVKIKSFIAQKIKIQTADIKNYKILKRSIDARSRNPIYRIKVLVYINEFPHNENQNISYSKVGSNRKVIIVGSGPAGLFAALKLIENGIKPIIIERGKNVRSRRRDLKAIQRDGIVNPNSNYCFGEGGAGTYSDGKLYTRATKRGDVNRIMQILTLHGAPNEIMIDSHPHIGSNKLPKIVETIRNTIIENNGEIHFDSLVTDLIIMGDSIHGVIVNNEKEFLADSVILATGHSARDIYYLLHNKRLSIEKKEFAVGVRIEHPQSLIDSIQYHSNKRNENLPAASYSLTCQINGLGVFSFCMCPGGIIVPASTSPEELVLNGMSVSRRDSKFANSGYVVTVGESELKKYEKHGVFSGIEMQKSLERMAFEIGGKTQRAPAQRITDFTSKKISKDLPATSYIPGIISAPLHELLPEFIVNSISESFKVFNKKMHGYYTEDAQILGVETRTSSPIRIIRDKDNYMHPDVKGLFPCGEGAGYAGGIVSAAIDGENTANAVSQFLQ